MDPITISALTMAAASGANAAATGSQNRKSRQFSRETYAKTKADNIAFWNMQNEYNSPEKQMERLKNAGLNPNMLYDKTGAVIPAQNISTPDVQSAQFRTPDFGSIGTGLVQGYFDTKIKQAQYDNLKAQNTVAVQEAALKAAQAAGEVSRTEGQGYMNSFAKANAANALRKASLETDKIAADIHYTLSENERKAAMQAPNLEIAAQTVLKMKAETATSQAQKQQIYQAIDNLKQDYRLKQFEEELAAQGIFKWDPLWARALAQFLQGLVGDNISPTSLGQGARKYLQEPWSPAKSIIAGPAGTFYHFYNKFNKK